MAVVKIDREYTTNLLTTAEETYIVSLSNYLEIFEKNKDKFELVNGIYITNSYIPLIEYSSIYYTRNEDGFRLINSNDDIKSNKGDIYRLIKGNYELYITYKQLKKLEPQLTIKPNANYVYLLFMKELIDQVINSYMNYRTHVSQNRLINYIKTKHKDYIKFDQYMEDFTDLFDEIYELIKNNRWHIYFTKTLNNSIVIERTCDYRAYNWCLDQIEDEDE